MEEEEERRRQAGLARAGSRRPSWKGRGMVNGTRCAATASPSPSRRRRSPGAPRHSPAVPLLGGRQGRSGPDDGDLGGEEPRLRRCFPPRGVYLRDGDPQGSVRRPPRHSPVARCWGR